MIFTMRRCVAVLFAAALALSPWAGAAHAQSTGRQSRLSAMQQFNALQQQQSAVQTAVQQTTLALQNAYQQGVLSQEVQSGTAPPVSTASPVNLQQQQIAFQTALQQTTALLQVSYRQNTGLGQTALRQMNTLQNALQQSIALQSSLSMQNGQLTLAQLQTLSQEQANLMGLTTSPPPLPGRVSRK